MESVMKKQRGATNYTVGQGWILGGTMIKLVDKRSIGYCPWSVVAGELMEGILIRCISQYQQWGMSTFTINWCGSSHFPFQFPLIPLCSILHGSRTWVYQYLTEKLIQSMISYSNQNRNENGIKSNLCKFGSNLNYISN